MNKDLFVPLKSLSFYRIIAHNLGRSVFSTHMRVVFKNGKGIVRFSTSVVSVRDHFIFKLSRHIRHDSFVSPLADHYVVCVSRHRFTFFKTAVWTSGGFGKAQTTKYQQESISRHIISKTLNIEERFLFPIISQPVQLNCAGVQY